MIVWSFVLLLSAAPLAIAAESPRPRGVSPEYAKFYKSKDSFACISNPSITLRPSQINDDFCDCPDGSDEPGTSACSHLSPLSPKSPGTTITKDTNSTLALPGFYCKNKGHNPGYVPFSYVNDGVCDYSLCCDGSDEWAHVGGVKCEDRCKDIGKTWKKQNEARVKSMQAAMRKKSELVSEATKLRGEIEAWLEDSTAKVSALELKVTNLEKEKAEVERQERGKVVKSSGQGGNAGVLSGLAKTRLGQLAGALTTVKTQRDSLQERISELEGILSSFKEDYNPNFNDEGVKRAVRSWEEYAARAKPDGAHDGFETDLTDLVANPDNIAWADYENTNDATELDVLYAFEAYLPAPLRSWIDEKLRDLRLLLIENGILAEPSKPEGESQAVKDAREKHQAAVNELNDIKRQKTDKEDSLNQDYGDGDAFRSIKGKCVSLDAGEYTYELCWMGSVTQISKKGGSRNAMGNFINFETTQVDEDVSADGKGLGKGERVVMKYDNGAHCWQGPNRRTTVVLACAENEEIWKVMEEEKCVYRIEAGTPAVCMLESERSAKADTPKEEL